MTDSDELHDFVAELGRIEDVAATDDVQVYVTEDKRRISLIYDD